MNNFKWNPLEKRSYKHKNPSMEFFCPLCGSERAFHSSPRLSFKNYLQLILCSSIAIAIAFPLMGPRSFFIFFVFLAAFEAGFRMNFRKEIPCPHCGFDASWYKKDVKVARRLVEEFWKTKNGPSASVAQESEVEELLDAVSSQREQEEASKYRNF